MPVKQTKAEKDQEKAALERGAVDAFIKKYNQTHKISLSFVRTGELSVDTAKPSEPDVVCSLNGKTIGVEVVHLYGSPLDVFRLLDVPIPLSPDEIKVVEQANCYQPISKRLIEAPDDTVHLDFIEERLGGLEKFKGDKGRKKLAEVMQFVVPQPLNKLLVGKAEKSQSNYSISPVWLLVRCASPLGDKKHFGDNRRYIKVPPNHRFKRIWLLTHYDNGLVLLAK